MSNIKDRVLGVVKEVLNAEHNSSDILDASFKEDLALTSLEQLTLFVALEDEFDRNIPQEEVVGIDTIREIVDYVEGKLSQSTA